MVDGGNSNRKQQNSSNNKSFVDHNQTKVVLRHLPPTLTSEQFLDIVSPLPDHDYYRFCKPDPSLGQQNAFCRAYLNIVNRQDLIVFTEKFQGYVLLDKNGNEYPCLLEYSPNQSKPNVNNSSRKDPKINSIEQDPEYQAFVTSMNAPISAADALPNPEAMLEEIEKKQRESHDPKNKFALNSTPLLEYLKRKREEKKQKNKASMQLGQSRSNKQHSRNNDESRPSTSRSNQDDEFYSSPRFSNAERSNRNQHRHSEKGENRSSHKDQKRSNNNDYISGKSLKGNSKSKQQTGPTNFREPKPTKIVKGNEDPTPSESLARKEINSAEPKVEPSQLEDRPVGSAKSSNQKTVKNRPSIQIYNPSERARLRREQNPPS